MLRVIWILFWVKWETLKVCCCCLLMWQDVVILQISSLVSYSALFRGKSKARRFSYWLREKRGLGWGWWSLRCRHTVDFGDVFGYGSNRTCRFRVMGWGNGRNQGCSGFFNSWVGGSVRNWDGKVGLGKDKVTEMHEERRAGKLSKPWFLSTGHERKRAKHLGKLQIFLGKQGEKRINRSLETLMKGQKAGCSVTDFHQSDCVHTVTEFHTDQAV